MGIPYEVSRDKIYKTRAAIKKGKELLARDQVPESVLIERTPELQHMETTLEEYAHIFRNQTHQVIESESKLC